MENFAKPASKSTTIVGAVATLAVTLVGLFGLPVDAGTVTEVVTAGAALVTTGFTIWGRLKATNAIQGLF